MARKHAPKNPSLEDAVALLRQRFAGQLAPPLEGLAYRFTTWLPILAEGRPVFTAGHRILLGAFFHACFGGFSQSNVEAAPPWSGSWLPEGVDEPVVDHHIHLIIYSLQDASALTCMRQLKWILQQDQEAAQQVVLIEKIPVHLIEAEALVR
jgi:hypothetical protein